MRGPRRAPSVTVRPELGTRYGAAVGGGDATEATAWAALLRAVNLGGRNRVPMADLRDALTGAGFEAVRTYIASGNVVFRHAEPDRATLAGAIEELVERSFGVTTTAILRTAGELRALVDAHPFGRDTSNSHVTFLAGEPDAVAVTQLEALDIAPDAFHVVGGDVFLHYPNGVQGSRLTIALLERRLGVPGTNRTWKSVERVAELAAKAEDESEAA